MYRQDPEWQLANQGSQFKSLQTLAKEPNEEHDKKNVLKPNARIYAYTKGDAKVGGSKIVTGQLLVVNKLARVLFDSGATHSFISAMFVDCFGRNKENIGQTFKTVLLSGNIMFLSY